MTHGRVDEAESLVSDIETDVSRRVDAELPDPDGGELEVNQEDSVGFLTIARTIFGEYPRRTVLGFALMAGQAFLYNAVLFTFAIVLTTFFGVSASSAGLYLVPFGIANFLGALLLGRFFDTVGRRRMIAGTYVLSGLGVAIAGYLLRQDAASTDVFVGILCASFFVASAAASSAYLTVSEAFPLETRAMAIGLFYAVATGIGGASGPLVFGSLIGTGDRSALFIGYAVAAGLMIIAGLVEVWIGIDAEQEALEDIAEPVSVEEAAT